MRPHRAASMKEIAINFLPIQRASRICALAVGAIGALGIAGWVFDVSTLQRIIPQWVTLKFNTALALVLAAVSLFLQAEEGMRRLRRWLAPGCAAVVTAIGLLSLGENLFGWDLGIDQLVFKESLAAAGMSFPGRMGAASALVLSCLGAALLFLDQKVAGKFWTEWLVSAAVLATMLVFLYYFYGLGEGGRFEKWLTISLHAVVAFYTLALGVILVRPQRGILPALLGPKTGSVLVRRMLPVAVGLPMVLGWLMMQAYRGGMFGPGFAMTGFVLAVILIFTLFIQWTANELDRDEAVRAQERLRVDVLRLEAKELAAAASKAKDDFLAALSHELRTPLTPVLMMASSLELDMDLPQTTREQLGMMRRNVELEARIIDDLLDITRIRHGKLTLALEVADIHELVEHTAEVLHSDFLGKGVRVVFTLAAERHHALVDPARLQQVVWNLIKNAIKFTPAGGVITVQTRNDEEERIVLSVADTGAGISAEALPGIFAAFEQGDAAGQHRFGGLGLGLAISHAIVVAHGGTVHGESGGVGMGAIFSVALAVVDAPAALAQAREAQSAPVRTLRLLVVEDHETTRSVLTQLLTRYGHSVTAVGTVQAALAAFAAEHFDVVVSDLGLPDGSGLGLMREIQRQRPVPAIALSGYGMEGDLRETKAAGFAAHLVKPVNIVRLRLLIEQLALSPAGRSTAVPPEVANPLARSTSGETPVLPL